MPVLNLIVLVLSSVLFTVFYARSVQPAARERTLGEAAYAKCATDRIVASVFMFVAAACYVLYYWFPLPLPLPRTFPWPWWVSAVLAVLIGVPSGYLMLRGVRDAGEETMRPRSEHTLYGGIYTRIRHPQALGELPLWWVMALLVHSPFLVLFSFLYVPVWYYWCVLEERDLVLRYGEAYEEYRRTTGFWLPRH
jgi:protein-S-isoprenylcysteine O-methyltransferase Ste14